MRSIQGQAGPLVGGRRRIFAGASGCAVDARYALALLPAMAAYQAFLLSAVQAPGPGGVVLRLFGRSPELGPVELRFEQQSAVFFVPRRAQLDQRALRCRRKAVELKSFDGESVDALYFQSEGDLRRARAILREAGVQCLEDDVSLLDRFLMERFLCGAVSFEAEEGDDLGRRVFLNPRLKPGRVRTALSALSLDIETGVKSGALYSIAVDLRGPQQKQKVVFLQRSGAAPLSASARNEGFELQCFEDERSCLAAFLQWTAERDPDLLIGWNVVGFDLRFLEAKCRAHSLPFRLGRDGLTAEVRPRTSGGDRAAIPGRVCIDGPLALRAAFYNFEDLSLDSVAHELLGEGKLISSGGSDKIAEIERLYAEDPLQLARYNLRDAELVQEIFAKTGLAELTMRRSEISGLLMGDIGQSVRAFDFFMLPRLHRKGYVAISQQDVRFSQSAPGGRVLQPVPGLYQQVVALDFRSLYPSIIRTFHIDPYSLLMRDHDPLSTPAGDRRFSRSEHLLPDFIGELFELRAAARREGDEHLSMAIKILMNSFYGVMGSPGCRFYHADLPNAITLTGQWLLTECVAWLEERGYRTLYGDTDSLFVQLRPEDEAAADQRAQQLADELNEYWQRRLADEFQLTSYLKLQFERRFSKFFLPPMRGQEKGARKRYAGLRVDAGVETLHFTGMEVVRSDWTELAREFQRELYARVFRGEDPSDWIRAVVGEVRLGQRDTQLVYRKRLRKPLAEYTQSAPPHVQAARMLPQARGVVRYVVTREGPVPVELKPQSPDYDHYVDKQLAPIADGALWLFGKDFESLVSSVQLSLF
ncbi:MAG: DNA polymerase II [Leptospirales bacterium]|nr:DNA polymerase II [Leptospirales bacterium]